MIKAVYLGIDDKPLESGRVYKVTTQCRGDRLIVSVRGIKRSYRNLEHFLKEWKVRAVYHE